LTESTLRVDKGVDQRRQQQQQRRRRRRWGTPAVLPGAAGSTAVKPLWPGTGVGRLGPACWGGGAGGVQRGLVLGVV
jgi:hypothetical protein